MSKGREKQKGNFSVFVNVCKRERKGKVLKSKGRTLFV
jgi:hypothetical protein